MSTQTKEPEDRLAGAKSQGQAQFESILEMVQALRVAEGDGISRVDELREQAEQRIHEDALSVEVRSEWYTPGASSFPKSRESEDCKPAEYRILLCTGGPACQIVGELDAHCEPETARMEVQDWFQPWTAYRPRRSPAGEGWRWDEPSGEYRLNDHGEGPEAVAEPSYDTEEVMLAYARCFWFGE